MLYVVYCEKKKHSKYSRECGFLAGLKAVFVMCIRENVDIKLYSERWTQLLYIYMCLPLVEMDRPIWILMDRSVGFRKKTIHTI